MIILYAITCVIFMYVQYDVGMCQSWLSNLVKWASKGKLQTVVGKQLREESYQIDKYSTRLVGGLWT